MLEQLHLLIDNPCSRIACKMITLATVRLNNHLYASNNLLQWILPYNLTVILLQQIVFWDLSNGTQFIWEMANGIICNWFHFRWIFLKLYYIILFWNIIMRVDCICWKCPEIVFSILLNNIYSKGALFIIWYNKKK